MSSKFISGSVNKIQNSIYICEIGYEILHVITMNALLSNVFTGILQNKQRLHMFSDCFCLIRNILDIFLYITERMVYLNIGVSCLSRH